MAKTADELVNWFPISDLPRSGSVAVSCLLVSGVASGQDALTRALSLEPVIAPTQTAPVDLRTDQRHLGPVQLSIGIYAGAEANDNIYYSATNSRPDLLLRSGLNLHFLWPATDQSEVRFGASL